MGATKSNAEVAVRYSLVKCLGWCLCMFAIFGFSLWVPFSSGQFELNGRYAWLWPIVAIGAPYMAVLALGLLFRALTCGGRAVAIQGGDLMIYYPFSRKVFSLEDVSSVFVSERRVEAPAYTQSANIFRIPTEAFIPQVTIAFQGGKTVNLPTRLYSTSAATIAADLTALLPKGKPAPSR